MKTINYPTDDYLQELGNLFSRLGKGISLEYGNDSVCPTPVLDKVLLILGSETSINIKRIASILMITSGAATQHVGALEKLGAVRRTISPEDRREINVHLTVSGQELYKKTQVNRLNVLRNIFKDFNETELQSFIKLMNKASKKYHTGADDDK